MRTFVGKIVKIPGDFAAQDVIPTGIDPRFNIAIEVYKSDTDRETVETRVYKIHSPSRFYGFAIEPEKAMGRVFVFKESKSVKTGTRWLEVVELKDK